MARGAPLWRHAECADQERPCRDPRHSPAACGRGPSVPSGVPAGKADRGGESADAGRSAATCRWTRWRVGTPACRGEHHPCRACLSLTPALWPLRWQTMPRMETGLAPAFPARPWLPPVSSTWRSPRDFEVGSQVATSTSAGLASPSWTCSTCRCSGSPAASSSNAAVGYATT